jgi:peptide/nickel transport system substrate-binding protein
VPLQVLAQGRESGNLNVIVQPEPPGLMVGILQNATTQLVAGNIYEGLVRLDEKLDPHPLLAQSWEMSSDGLSYTFKLKPGVKWHDGKPFSAQDVVFSVDVFLRKTHVRLRGNMEVVESISALDDLTVQFKLKRTFGPFLALFETGSMPMIPKHIYEGSADFLNHPANNQPLGTGPFKFKKWVKGSYIHLEANADYHQPGVPTVKNLYFHVIPDAAARAAAFESGKVDVAPGGTVEYFDVERLAKLPGAAVTTKGWEFFAPLSWLWINNRKKPMDNPKFRQAIMYALDRAAMAKAVFYGFAKVATGPCNSSIKYYSDEVTKYPRDLDKAKALLRESGYQGETLRLLPMPYGETWQRVAEIIRQNLQQAGIKIEMVATDVAGWNQRLNEWDFDLSTTYVYQYGDPALGVARNYISSQIVKGSIFNNVEGYSNPKVDALFAAGMSEIDPVKRGQIYKEAQKLLVDEVPVAWLHELTFPTLYRKVDNLVSSGTGLNDSLAYAKFL